MIDPAGCMQPGEQQKGRPPMHVAMADKNDLQAAASLDEIKEAQRPLHLDNNNNKTAPPPPVAHGYPWNWMVVYLWSIFNAFHFPATAMINTILALATCSPTETEVPSTEVWFLLSGELLCGVAVATALAAAPLQPMLLLTTTPSGPLICRQPAAGRRFGPLASTTSRVLLWVALAATVGMHCMNLACDRIVLATAGHGSTFHVAFHYVCLAVDLLVAGVLLSSPPMKPAAIY